MAKPTKRRVEGGRPTSGRVTPKRTDEPTPSQRYTPPSPKLEEMPSPAWVPVLMFAFLGLGLVIIFLNYTGVLPGAPTNWYLLGGLGAILAGIITATQYR